MIDYIDIWCCQNHAVVYINGKYIRLIDKFSLIVIWFFSHNNNTIQFRKFVIFNSTIHIRYIDSCPIHRIKNHIT